MQVFKTFFKVLWQQKKTMIIYLIVFLVLEVMMAAMGSEDSQTVYTQQSYNIAVFDEDQSGASAGLADFLGSKNVLVNYPDDKETIQDELYARNIVACIRIPEGFSDALESGTAENAIEITSIPGTLYESVISQQINQFAGSVSTYLSCGYDMKDSIAEAKVTLTVNAKVSLLEHYANGQKSKMYYFFLYIPYLLICVSMVGVGACLIVFNRKEIADRMTCSSTSLFNKNMGLLSGTVLAELLLAAIFILICSVMNISGIISLKGLFLILNTICFSAVSLSITYLIGIFAKDVNVLNMVGNVVGLAMSFLGGIFVSLDLFSDTMATAAHFMPTYWYVSACDVIEKGVFNSESYKSIGSCFGIQLLFAAAVIAVTLVVSRLKASEQ